jgi:hypothetical protein
MRKNEFYVIGMTAVVLAFSAVVALIFGGCPNPTAPVPDTPVPTPVVSGLRLTDYVTAPVKGTGPVDAAIVTDRYEGTVEWQDANGDAPGGDFVAGTVYNVLKLTAKPPFSFDGVTAASFSYSGAESITIEEKTSGTNRYHRLSGYG